MESSIVATSSGLGNLFLYAIYSINILLEVAISIVRYKSSIRARQGSKNGFYISIYRREHFCILNRRMDFTIVLHPAAWEILFLYHIYVRRCFLNCKNFRRQTF